MRANRNTVDKLADPEYMERCKQLAASSRTGKFSDSLGDFFNEEYPTMTLTGVDVQMPLPGTNAPYRVRLKARRGRESIVFHGRGNTRIAAYISAMSGGDLVVETPEE